MQPQRALKVELNRLRFLASQLELGAPGVAFCLAAPRTTIELVLGPDADPFDVRLIAKQREEKGLTLDDIAYGIDGYAIQLFQPDYHISEHIFYDTFEQECFSRLAVRLLGLPWMDKGPQFDCGHELFNPTGAPWDCTPEQAAGAVRRVIEGKEPWKYEE